MKAFLKFILVLILIPVILIVVLYFIEGGNGRKEPTVLPVKNPESPLIFAHRGVSDGVPENSLPAIEKAKKLGYKALEVDIRKTADNEMILFHDANALRLLGVDTTISSLTMEEIRQMKLLWKGDTTKFGVMTLKELLDKYREDFIFYFDMKIGSLNDIDDVVHMVWSYDISRNVIIACPSITLIMYIEYHYPAINTALEGFHTGNDKVWYLIPKKLKPDFLSGFASKVDDEHIKFLRKNNLLQQRILHSIDSSRYQQMLDLGINKMITDYRPERMVP